MSLSCLCDLIGMYSSFVATQFGTLGFIGLISYSTIVYAFLTDIFIFKEHLDIVEILAASVILLTTIGVSIYKIRVESKLKTTAK